jgi:Holliday junction resolvase RusA-like endonuclease
MGGGVGLWAYSFFQGGQKMQFAFTFPGEPVPFQRPRFNGKFVFNDKRYSNYKSNFSAAIKHYFENDIKPSPKTGTKERALFLNQNRYRLKVKAYRSANRGDIDNFIKTVQDALQDSGLIADDAQIDKVVGTKFIDKINPRIEFILEQTQSQEQFKFLTGEE